MRKRPELNIELDGNTFREFYKNEIGNIFSFNVLF